MFSVCLILFHFILFLSNFTPFGSVVFFSLFGVLVFSCCRGQFQWVRDCKSRLNLNPMEDGQYGQHVAGGNPRAYMKMRDYRNLAWQNQQPLGRNPNPNRSMRYYRDQGMSAPIYSVPPNYAPPVSPHFTSTPQPPQFISPVEQVILNLRKLVDNFKEEQRVVNVQANQEIETVENSLNKELDVFQSKIDMVFDILQPSISLQEEENLEEECLTETILGEQDQLQPQEELKVEPAKAHEELQEALESCAVYGPWRREEEILPLLTEEAVEECQDHNLPLPHIDSVYILPTHAAHSNPRAPTGKATSIALPIL